MDYTLGRLLGGVANGLDAPSYWDTIAEWEERGTGRKTIYEKRYFFHRGDKFTVWVATGIPEPDFQAIMQWHREMYRGDFVAIQKEVLKESIAAATSYTNVILAVGYAAMAALLSAGKPTFTPVTYFSATIFLSISVFAFVAWEVYGMIVRSRSNIALAQAVNDPETFETRMSRHQEEMAGTMRRLQPLWVLNVGVAAGCGIVSFAIMVFAYIHAAWMAL